MPNPAWIGRRWTCGDAIGLGVPDVRGRVLAVNGGRRVEVRPFSPRDEAELVLEPAGFRASVPREAVAGAWGVGDYTGARGLAPQL